MTTHLVIGNGEVGSAVYKLLGLLNEKVVAVIDIAPTYIPNCKWEFMHVAFPYITEDQFINAVREYEEEYSPEIIVIHSTVPPGATRKLGKNVVHIPTHGKHPNIYEWLLSIKMYIGGQDNSAIKRVANIFDQIGCKTRPLYDMPPETSELTKAMCTTYMAWNVVFEKFMYELCKHYNVPFEVVYTEWNHAYNEGVIYPEKHNRPVLDHMEGGFGGHCLYENAVLMGRIVPEDMKWLFKIITDIGK